MLSAIMNTKIHNIYKTKEKKSKYPKRQSSGSGSYLRNKVAHTQIDDIYQNTTIFFLQCKQ